MGAGMKLTGGVELYANLKYILTVVIQLDTIPDRNSLLFYSIILFYCASGEREKERGRDRDQHTTDDHCAPALSVGDREAQVQQQRRSRQFIEGVERGRDPGQGGGKQCP